MSSRRHKVFVSYYHNDDQFFKDELIKMKFFDTSDYKIKSIFEDYSVGNGDIDDTYMTAESIRRTIRDQYMQQATVLILLCGQNTRKRKHIDWEIHTAMYDTDINPKMGILVINLPSIRQSCRANNDREKQLISPNATWVNLQTRKELEEAYPYMPERLLDNFEKGVCVSVVDWSSVQNNPEKLIELIDNAFQWKDINTYDHSRPLRRNNS